MSFRPLWLLCLVLPGLCLGLFEDQAFKFDWRRQHVGQVVQARLWETNRDAALMVRSNKGVIAAIDADTGNLRWRHVGEEEERVLEIKIEGSGASAIVATVGLQRDEGLGSQVSLRTWNPMSGALITEKVFEPTVLPKDGAFVVDGQAHLVSADDKGAVKVAVYSMKRGQEIIRAHFQTGAGEKVKCLNANDLLACFSKKTSTLYYAGLPLESEKGAFNLVSLEQLGMPQGSQLLDVVAMPGTVGSLRVSLKSKNGAEEALVVAFKEGRMAGSNLLINEKQRSVRIVTGCKNTDDLIALEQECVDEACTEFKQNVKISKMDAKSKKSVYDVEYSFSRLRGRVVEAWGTCSGDDDSFQLVLLNEDASLSSVSAGAQEVWTREEGLAAISRIEVVAKVQEVVEDSASADANDILGHLIKRVKRHTALINTAFTKFLELKELASQSTSFLAAVGGGADSGDDFGIHKVIVAFTENGNVYAIDSKKGAIKWKLFFPGVNVQDGSLARLIVQRTSDHFGLSPRCVLVYTDSRTDQAQMVAFNPMTGDIVDAKSLGKDLAQIIPLHHADHDHLKPLLLLRKNQQVELEPASAAGSLFPKSFIVTLDADTGLIRGQKLSVASGDRIKLTPLWTLANPGAKVLNIEGKPSDEVVHSQGRVMADRSVLFKYINPNLGFILSEGNDAAGKPFINVYLVDLVTGKVVFSANHKRVHGPYHVVHSENWAVYSYYNEKARRGELTSLEMFEGNTQSNGTVFSSLSSDVSPLVERQSYILGPSHVTAIMDTRTEKGITSKNLLMATSNGFVYNVPRHILDPRRPNINTPPEMREPGLPPYIPELALPPETVLNYNQTLARPVGVVTAPTGLESTSVTFVYGLDLFCTRVTPSKGFDLLKEDFDYSIISLVLVALVAAAYGTRRLSQRKNLKAAWR